MIKEPKKRRFKHLAKVRLYSGAKNCGMDNYEKHKNIKTYKTPHGDCT